MTLLPCVCGAEGRPNPKGLIFCTAGHAYCEREDFTPEQWNTATAEYYKMRVPDLRKAAKNMMAEAKRMEKIVNEIEGEPQRESGKPEDAPLAAYFIKDGIPTCLECSLRVETLADLKEHYIRHTKNNSIEVQEKE